MCPLTTKRLCRNQVSSSNELSQPGRIPETREPSQQYCRKFLGKAGRYEHSISHGIYRKRRKYYLSADSHCRRLLGVGSRLRKRHDGGEQRQESGPHKYYDLDGMTSGHEIGTKGAGVGSVFI